MVMNFIVFACDAALISEVNKLIVPNFNGQADGTRLGGFTMLVFCMLFNMALIAIHVLKWREQLQDCIQTCLGTNNLNQGLAAGDRVLLTSAGFRLRGVWLGGRTCCDAFGWLVPVSTHFLGACLSNLSLVSLV
jgi:hypothetical protein